MKSLHLIRSVLRFSPVLGAFWIVYSYALFFFVAPLYDMNPDYFDYYSLTHRWLQGDWGNYEGVLIDLPLGLPAILYVQKWLGLSSLALILVFCLTLLISYWFLARRLVQYRGWAGGLSALFLALFLTDGESMRQFTSLMPDAPYVLVLLWTLFFLLGLLQGKHPHRETILFALFALLLPVFRSNGIGIFPVLLALGIGLWMKRRFLAHTLFKSMGVLLVCLIGLSFLAVGYVNYGNPYRILTVLGQRPAPKKIHQESNPKPKKRASCLNTYYLYSFSLDRSQFFLNQIPTRIHKHLMYKKTSEEANYGMYDGASPVPPAWRTMVQQEFDALAPKFNLNAQRPSERIKSVQLSRTALLLYHAVYRFYSMVFNSAVSLFLFYGLSLLFLFKSFRSSNLLSFEIAVLAVFFSMVAVLLVGSGLSLPRYAFPTDLLPILLLPLLYANTAHPFIQRWIIALRLRR